MRAVNDDEFIRVMVSNVKVVAPGLAQATRSTKEAKKSAATSRKKAATP